MTRGDTGRYEITAVGGESVRAFVPDPLPPAPPPAMDGVLQSLFEIAALAVGRLDGVSTLLPDKSLFLYAYVRKEAVLSSQIEGTQSSLSDLLLFELDEAPGVPLDDVVEVSNYVAALDHGLARLRGGFPLSNRLIREIHGVLLSRGRGSGKDPGEFRRSQNWIGGTRPGNAVFVPAAAHRRARLHGRAGTLPPRRGRRAAGARAGRTGPRAVRDHPSVPRRQRPRRPAADHVPSLPRGPAAGTPALPQPLLQAAPAARTTSCWTQCAATATGRPGWRSSSRA